MADKEILVIRDPRTLSRQETAREMKELKKNPLDRAPAGGRFLTIDGKAHDAEGFEVELEAKDKDAIRDARVQRGMAPDPEDDGPQEGGGTEPAPKEMRGMSLQKLQTEAARRGVRVPPAELGRANTEAKRKAAYLQAMGVPDEEDEKAPAAGGPTRARSRSKAGSGSK